MNKSPIYPRYEMGSSCDYDFDPQLDLVKFLKDARSHVYDYKTNVEVESPNSTKRGNARQSSGGLRSKKSWKGSLFSWLKTHRKSDEPNMQSSYNSNTMSTLSQRRYVSGPIPRGGGGIVTRLRRQNSGPPTGILNSANRRDEKKMQEPYVCLDKLNNNPSDFDRYGPVYLVT